MGGRDEVRELSRGKGNVVRVITGFMQQEVTGGAPPVA